MKKIVILLIIILAIVIIGIAGIFIWYNNNLKPVSKLPVEENEVIRVEIPEGYGISDIAKLLEDSNIIKSATVMKIYSKLNNISSLKAGKYDFNNSEDMPQIVAHILNGEVANDEVNITFIEGKNMRWIAKTIADKTVNTEEDVYNLLSNEEYIDSLIEKYWFITDEIKDDRIYYPLEGYLLPDTYTFENDEVSVETIFNVILNFTQKYLDGFKDEIESNNLTVHQILTLASIAELEGKSTEDRAEIIGVFFNRINDKMSLGSDVTTYYAFKVDMGDRDLTAKELNTENPYNTRGPNMAGKIPVGPICNPSKSAIEATLNYKETDAYYFVADKNGKVYFTKTNEEHNQIIKQLKDEGLWYVYE
ncbi:MAG TPA: endolytic transglycosylase MltG [Candidatus Scatovivens faecipullorum]|nr:endolytic transglycosylase MltG [Candidatus Scatovivens faecipullorum]